MAKIQNYTSKLNLEDYDVYIEDTEFFSDYFRISELTSILTSGKNAFLINGSPYLKQTTEVLVELLDSENNPVYLHPIRNYTEGLARVVSMEIYKTTPRGKAKLIILGEAKTDKNGVPVPERWKGKYNVRYTRELVIDPTILNVTPIRLYDRPDLNVQEIQVPYVEVRSLGRSSLESASLMSSPGVFSFLAGFAETDYRVTSNLPLIITEMEKNGVFSASIFSTTTVSQETYITAALDTFTDTDNTLLVSHSPDIGWTLWKADTIPTPSPQNSLRIFGNILSSSNSIGAAEAGNVVFPAIKNNNFTTWADVKCPQNTTNQLRGIKFRSSELFTSSSDLWEYHSVYLTHRQDAVNDFVTFSTRKSGSAVSTTALFSGSLPQITGSGYRIVCGIKDLIVKVHLEAAGGGAVLFGPWTKTLTSASSLLESSSDDTSHAHFGIQSNGSVRGHWDNFTVLTTSSAETPTSTGSVYSGRINRVLSDTTFTLKYPYLVESTTGEQYNPKWKTTEWSIVWDSGSTELRTEESRSFAEIVLTNLRTFSGDVARAKFYVKTVEGLGAYKPITELSIEEHELTLTQSYNTGEVNIQMGEFRNQEFTDQYWIADSVNSSSYSS